MMIKSVRKTYDPFKKEETVIIELTPEMSANLQNLDESFAWRLWDDLMKKLDEQLDA